MRKKFTLHQSNRLSSIILRSATIIFALALIANFATTLAPTLKANAESTTTSRTVEGLKSVTEYDSELSGKSDEEIMKDDNLKLQLLQRTFLKRVDPDKQGEKAPEKLKTFANASEANYEALKYLFNNRQNLEDYLLGGTAEGKASNYLDKSLPIFSKLYEKYKADIDDSTYGSVFRKMMMAISLAYGDDVTGWQTYKLGNDPWHRVKSEPEKRYEVIKKLLTTEIQFDDVKTDFDKATFTDLEIEEMRWVVNNRIADEEIDWLNWFTQKVKNGNTAYGSTLDETTGLRGPNPNGYMNPYTYIYYDGGSHWFYEDPDYYKENSDHCALSKLGNINKFHNSDKYQRGENCNNKYGLEHFSALKSSPNENRQLRLWTIMEEDGVCGSLAGVGSNIQMAYGIPSSLVSQPGHAAYFVSSQKDFNGEKLRFWEIGNSVSSWPNSYKGERMMLNWGTRNIKWSDDFNAPYLLSAQSAVDHFDKYAESFYYNQIADVRTDFNQKVDSYKNAIQALKFNIDSWYGLIQETLKTENNITSQQFYEMAKKLIEDMKEFPMPMADLLKLFQDKIDIVHQIPFQSLYNSTLTELSNTPTNEESAVYLQAQAIRQVANYLLGKAGDTEVAEFSFDGDNANKLMLKGIAKDAKAVFEYSINSSADDPSTGDWIQIADGSNEADLTNVAKDINDKNDILVHVQGTARTKETVFKIDIQDSTESDKLSSNAYANKLERKISGIDEDITEWIEIKDDNECSQLPQDDYDKLLECYQNTDTFKLSTNPDALDWKKFSDEEPIIPEEGNKVDGTTNMSNLYVRTSRHGVYLAGKTARNIAFDPATKNEQRDYIPVSEMSVKSTVYETKTVEKDDGSVEVIQEPIEDENLPKLLDGNLTTYWQNNPLDEDKDLTYELSKPTNLTSFEYILYSASSVGWGRIDSITLETSLDGENWNTIEDELEWKLKPISETQFVNYTLYYYDFEEPIYAKYIRITPLRMETITNALGQTVANSNARVTMFNFYRDNTAKIDISLLEPLLTMNEKTFTYNGEEQKPTITISDYDNTTLTPEKDYQITYENNRNAGTATMKIKGTGERYTGEVTKEFTINKAPNPPDTPEDSYDKTSDTEQKLSSFQLPNDWRWENGDQTIKPGESLLVTALYSDQDNYENASKKVNVSVTKPTTPPTIDPGPTNPDPSKPTDPDPSIPTDPDNPTNPTDPDTPTNPVDPSIPADPNDQPGANSPPQSGNTTTPSTSSGSSDANFFANPSSGTQIADNYSAGSHARSNPVNPATGNSTNDNSDNENTDSESSDSTSRNTESSGSQVADNEISDDSSTSDQQSSGNRNILPYIIAGIVAVSILAIFYFFFRRRNKE